MKPHEWELNRWHNIRRLVCLAAFVLGALAYENRPGHAQPQSVNENAARAKALFEQGTKLYRARDYAAAVPLFSEAARLGDARAQLQVGWHYEFGKGVRPNATEAVRWYLAAARQGNALAQCNVGTMYENGRGVAENWMQAAYWFAQSAKQNDPGGLYSLARAYEFGIGVPQNRSTALALYKKAVARGDSKASFAIQNLRQIGGVSFRTQQERQIFGLLPHNLPQDPAGRVFHNSRERLAYLKGERKVMDAAQAWRTYDLDKRQYDEQKREYDDGRGSVRPTEPRPPAFPRPSN